MQGEDQKKLDIVSNEVFCNALRNSGKTGVIASEEEDFPVAVEETYSGATVDLYLEPPCADATASTSLDHTQLSICLGLCTGSEASPAPPALPHCSHPVTLPGTPVLVNIDEVQSDAMPGMTRSRQDTTAACPTPLSRHIDWPAFMHAGNYVVVFDPLDGSSNIDAGISTGSIFGIYAPSEECSIDDMDDPEKMMQVQANTLAMSSSVLNALSMAPCLQRLLQVFLTQS